MDYRAHNAEVKQVWDSYHAGKPLRMPVILGTNPRIWLLNKSLNTGGISFRDYSLDADVMADVQARYQLYKRTHLIADHEMGLPERGWDLYVDLQNYYEAAWFGAQVDYPDWNVPRSRELFGWDDREMLFEQGIPEPFGGIYARALEMYEKLWNKTGETLLEGLPAASAGLPSHGTDGPMTAACNLFGAGNFCLSIYEAPDYAEKLLDFITDATIIRIKAWNKRFRGAEKMPSFGFADDSVALIGTDTYRDLVLPRHKRLVRELSTGEKPNSIHLCGDASRHFETIRDELGVDSFDTGYPIDPGAVQAKLGPDIKISGGPRADLLLEGTAEQVYAKTVEIIAQVKPLTKLFVMREANNLSPGTPPENAAAMFRAVREHGCYGDV